MLQQEVIRIWKRAHYFQIKNYKKNRPYYSDRHQVALLSPEKSLQRARALIARCYDKS
ncbi:MAG: hypothetical protein Tsb0014_06670 [Pleurocapsa sp.]